MHRTHPKGLTTDTLSTLPLPASSARNTITTVSISTPPHTYLMTRNSYPAPQHTDKQSSIQCMIPHAYTPASTYTPNTITPSQHVVHGTHQLAPHTITPSRCSHPQAMSSTCGQYASCSNYSADSRLVPSYSVGSQYQLAPCTAAYYSQSHRPTSTRFTYPSSASNLPPYQSQITPNLHQGVTRHPPYMTAPTSHPTQPPSIPPRPAQLIPDFISYIKPETELMTDLKPDIVTQIKQEDDDDYPFVHNFDIQDGDLSSTEMSACRFQLPGPPTGYAAISSGSGVITAAGGSVGSGLTPTTPSALLTPSTLTNIEQTFIELQAAGSPPTSTDSASADSYIPLPENLSRTRNSGFIPPVVDLSPSNRTAGVKRAAVGSDQSRESTPSTADDADWTPPVAKRRGDVGGVTTSVIKPNLNHSLAGVGSDLLLQSTATSRRHTGPRKPRNDEKLSDDERVKRDLRRERNKIAAAKCRQRRVDLTNVLINETENLEEQKAQLEDEIQALEQQREQMEFILEAHRPSCSVYSSLHQSVSGVQPAQSTLAVHSESDQLTVISSATPSLLNLAPGVASHLAPAASSHLVPVSNIAPATSHLPDVSIAPVIGAATSVIVKSERVEPSDNNELATPNVMLSYVIPGADAVTSAHSVTSRPQTLTLLAPTVASSAGGGGAAPVSQSAIASSANQSAAEAALGLTISTPSNGIISFASFQDDHTGLTPITGVPSAGIAGGVTPASAAPVSMVTDEAVTSTPVTSSESVIIL